MRRGMIILISAFLAIMFFILMFFLGRALFRSIGSTDKVPVEQTVKLGDYASKNSSVTMIISGPVVADENYRSVRIVVTKEYRRIEILQGFKYEVISEKSYPNNEEAYKAFLKALTGAGYGKSRIQNIGKVDEVTACASGTRTKFEVGAIGESSNTWWTSTCATQPGTFGGNSGSITGYFKSQIPDYDTITKDI